MKPDVYLIVDQGLYLSTAFFGNVLFTTLSKGALLELPASLMTVLKLSYLFFQLPVF